MEIPKDIRALAMDAFEAQSLIRSVARLSEPASDLLAEVAVKAEVQIQSWALGRFECPICGDDSSMGPCRACAYYGWEAQHVIELVVTSPAPSMICKAPVGMDQNFGDADLPF